MTLVFHADTLNGLIWNSPSALIPASQKPRRTLRRFVPGRADDVRSSGASTPSVWITDFR
jgi:hypothetical protein